MTQPDFTSPIAGRIEVREPCPWCADRPMVPRSLMDEHVARLHPEVQTVDASSAPASVVVPAADRAALRDRIAEQPCDGFPDACPNLRPILPDPPHHDGGVRCACGEEQHKAGQLRAAVLEEAADAVAADTGFHIRYGAAVDYAEHYAALLRRMAVESAAVDRVAAETPPAETEAHPPTATWKVESPRRDTWASWGATYDERDWAQERYESATANAPARAFRLVRATTTYTVEAERPAVEAQPGKDTETPRCVCGDPIQLQDETDPTSWIHSPGSDTPCLNARPS
ncbi:hypothetical protein IHE56_00985 [Streptomyces sp. ID01-12c]|nr:hypothetical protein [Streptomyces caniscabiei]